MALPSFGPRTRKILRYAGFVLLALVTYVFALQLTFPYGRVKAKVIEALSSKYNVTIQEVEPGWIPGRVYFHNIMLESRPAKADETPTKSTIKELEVDLGIMPLLGSRASVDFDATVGAGHITGTVSAPFNGRGFSIDVTGDDVPSALLPMRDLVGVPTSGKIDFGFALSLPSEKLKNGKIGPNWQKAEGAISLACPAGCVLGDGKSKLKLKAQNARQQAFAEDGIEFGTINVASLAAKVDIKKGHLNLTKFDFKSPDVELNVEYELTLAPVLDDSEVNGCLRFKGTEALAEREPKTHAALTTTGANIGPDGLFHITLDGRFGKMGRKARSCGPALKGNDNHGEDFSDHGGSGNHGRPNLTVQPVEELRGSAVMTAPPPPPPTPVDAAAPPSTPPPSAEGSDSDADDEAEGANHAGSAGPASPPGEPVPPGEGTAGAGGAGESHEQPPPMN
jgi:type II secretion system protein N